MTEQYAKMRDYQLKYQKERYARLKAEGRCTICCKELTAKGPANCPACQDYINRKHREQRRARKEAAANG